MAGRFADNPHYVEYERLLLQLHRLFVEGKDESEEADAVYEAMEAPAEHLSQEEIQRLKGLSADLYMLQDDEIFEPVDPAERTPERLGKEIEAAWKRRDWEGLLHLLRKGPTFMPPDGIAFLRHTAYRELGHLDTAITFLRYATTKNSSQIAYKGLMMGLLVSMERIDEALPYADLFLMDESAYAPARIQAASVLSYSTRRMSRSQARPIHKRVIRILERILHRAIASDVVSSEFLSDGYLLLGFNYERLGQSDKALEAYNTALRHEPEAEDILAARGLLLLDTDLNAAMVDFERAAKKDVSIPTPYIFLAEDALLRKDYTRCLQLCEKAISLTPKPSILAPAHHLKAIALAEMGAPVEDVLSNFAAAQQYAPSDIKIQHNLEVYKQSLLPGRATSAYDEGWQINSMVSIHDLSDANLIIKSPLHQEDHIFAGVGR